MCAHRGSRHAVGCTLVSARKHSCQVFTCAGVLQPRARSLWEKGFQVVACIHTMAHARAQKAHARTLMHRRRMHARSCAGAVACCI